MSAPVGSAAPAPAPPRAAPGTVLFWVVLAALVVGRLGGPIGGWLGAVGTAAHEVGHAVTADVLAGDVEGITVLRDGGGVTVSELTDSGWRRFMVAAAGYPATLLAALALLTGALLGRTGRVLAALGALAGAVALALWVPLRPHAPGISAADQRFTWFVLGLTVVLLAGAAALPPRYSTARRVVLGAVGVSLLSDAFRAADDLLTLHGAGRHTNTDAATIARVVDVGSPTVWAWLMWLLLLAIAIGWAWLLLRRWAAATVATPAAPATTLPTTRQGVRE